jgi:hypothetical protein
VDDSGKQNGTAASFYGSAGGGGGLYRLYDSTDGTDVFYYGNGGDGYQGVFYLLIPA